jgi:hypothetical protein
MRRISTIRNRQETEIEVRREELRNMRWARRRNMLLTAFALASGAGLFPTGIAASLATAIKQVLGV